MPPSEAEEAPALPPETRTGDYEKGPAAGIQRTPAPTQRQEDQSSSVEPNDSLSPSDGPSEGEYSGSESSKQRDSETPDKDGRSQQAQPPLPDEPLPGLPGLPGQDATAPPLPNEPLPETVPGAPPLPAEPAPEPEDDGWEFHWNPNDQSYWFYNRFTGVWQQENPRVPSDGTMTTTAAPGTAAVTATTTTSTGAAPGTTVDATSATALSNPASVAGGYNPAIHGDYDENAWYAQNLRGGADGDPALGGREEDYGSAALFNRRTGQWQAPEQGAERHSDEAKARRQMRAYFDVDAAANMHDGRSLKAERAGKKPSRAELKAFKERRRQKKEEKRRAWLRD